MLAPDTRTLYTECLEAPDGYRFDCGVATTFTLGLESLLVLPFTLAMRRAEDPDALLRDPVALLEALRETSHDLAVFCQDGFIHVPPKEHLLFSLLEDCVLPVRVPREQGIFHPKVWLLRFVSEDDDVLLRALVMSRNLTFDRSWDTVLCLEGEPRGRRVRDSYGLADLVRALPAHSTRPVDARRRGFIEDLAEQVAHTQFSAPEPFLENAVFHAIGVEGRRFEPRIEGTGRRVLCVSPFLSSAAIEEAAELASDERILISRDDQLNACSERALDGWDVQIIADEVEAADSTDVAPETSDDVAQRVPPDGLHAKMVAVEDSQGRVTWWIGSANLGAAAWHGDSIEMMVELRGRRAQVGIDAFLDAGFRKLLAPWKRSEPDPEAVAKQRALDYADQVRGAITAARLELRCEGDGDLWNLSLRGELALPDDVDARVWPVTLGEATHSRDLRTLASDLSWPGISAASVTSLLAVAVTAKYEKAQVTIRFALKLPHSGFPEDRHAHVLRQIVRSRSGFFRYLRLLLAAAQGDLGALALEAAGSSGGRAKEGGGFLLGLEQVVLEDLLRTLSREPQRLDSVDRLITDLTQTPEGRELVPPDFLALWETIRAVRPKSGGPA